MEELLKVKEPEKKQPEDPLAEKIGVDIQEL